jgi:glycosyltransferase involved in cell wall biosynthesis
MNEIKQQAPKISVIIAAYNEESRIANVLKVVEKCPLIDEVIVVNDGSKDNTSEVVKKYNVTLVENEKNMGKTLTVKKGIELAKNDIIMLLDADLVGLNDDAIEKLASPVLNGEVDWTLSIRSNSFGYMRLAKMDWVSGERVIPKRLLSDPLIWSRPDVGFGLETLMNKSLLGKNTTFRSVYLGGLVNTNKASKVGLLDGLKGEVKMVRQIAKVMPLHKVFGQFIKMAYLNKKYKKQLVTSR